MTKERKREDGNYFVVSLTEKEIYALLGAQATSGVEHCGESVHNIICLACGVQGTRRKNKHRRENCIVHKKDCEYMHLESAQESLRAALGKGE